MRTVLAGRLRLVDLVGEGGSGTVWQAWDTRCRTCVAVKVVPRVTGDAQPPTCPPHRHPVVPTERLLDGDAHVSVMRLVRGGTADRLLAAYGALPHDYVGVLLDQLLRALAAVHTSGLVHRDVKPANILLEPTRTGRPHLRLGDLDVAARLGEVPPVLVGTDGYVAPEAAPGLPADARQDLYAAGVTAAELLTGRIPSHADDLPRGPLRRLLAGLVHPDPGRRTSSAHEALRDLHTTGVPTGTPWRTRPHPPDVPELFGRVPVTVRWGYGVRAAQ